MQYRRFGSTGWEVSALGFGAMRLPTRREGEALAVDQDASVELIRAGIDGGINYVDTAYPYHDGFSEPVVGKALKDGYRDKVRLATKMPCWLVKEKGDFDRYLDEQLAKLGTSRIDYYLLHALWKDRWEQMESLGALSWAERAKSDGRIGSLCFSFHDGPELFRRVVDAYDWEMCQIQYNYMNENVQAGTAGLEYAASKGIAVVVMEPLLGGLLARPPEGIARLWSAAHAQPADLALRWIWDKAGVSTILSGMSDMAQLKANLASANAAAVGGLSQTERELVSRVRKAYEEAQAVPCTKCQYCLPCPSGVNIPRNFELYNQGVAFGDMGLSKSLYNYHFPEAERAKACVACGICETKCPQGIKISGLMPKIDQELRF